MDVSKASVCSVEFERLGMRVRFAVLALALALTCSAASAQAAWADDAREGSGAQLAPVASRAVESAVAQSDLAEAEGLEAYTLAADKKAKAKSKAKAKAKARARAKARAKAKRLPSGVYLIKPRMAPGQALGIEASSYKQKARVKAGTLDGTYSRMFYLKYSKSDRRYSIVSVHSGLALTASGKGLVQAGYKASPKQRFKLVAEAKGVYSLVAKSGKAVSVSSAGAFASLKKASAKSSQRFELVSAPLVVPGIYKLHSSKYTSQVAGAKGGSVGSGVAAQLADDDAGVGKMIVARSGNGYSLRALGSGAYLAAAGGKVKQRAKAFRWDASFANAGQRRGIVFKTHGGRSITATGAGEELVLKKGARRAQAFIPVRTALVDEGTYYMHADSGKVLDVDGGTYADGGNVQVWDKGDTSAQYFKVEERDGSHVITSARTLKALTSSDGNVVQTWYDGSASQQWRALVDAKGRIVFQNKATGKMLGAADKAKNNGANVQGSSFGSAGSGWALVPRGDYSLTGNAELDEAVSRVLEDHGSLSSAFWYAANGDRFRFTEQNRFYNFGDFLSDEDVADYALEMYNGHRGNCYRFASLFCVLARGLDFEANVRLGYFLLGGATSQTHGWVEVNDGGTSVYDVEMTAEYAGAGYVVDGTSYGYATSVASSFGVGGYNF